MVALMDASGSQFCGGTLVASKYVVTAAHCMFYDQNAQQPVPKSEVLQFIRKYRPHQGSYSPPPPSNKGSFLFFELSSSLFSILFSSLSLNL